MAGAARTDSHAIEWLRGLEQAPHRYGFFAALRYLECLHAEQPRIGEAAKPSDESLRLGQQPSLAFASSTLASFRVGGSGEPNYLASYFFGLFGPHGPLPLHLTELAHNRELNENDATLRKFADVFHHRMLSFFYRAWANAQPTVALDRPASARFSTYAGALLGMAPAEFRNRDALPDYAKFSRVGQLAMQTRPAQTLVEMLEDYFGHPFQVRQFVGEWLQLPSKSWLRLGVNEDNAQLGRSTVLGASVWSAQHAFQLICGPLNFDEFEQLLPGRLGLCKLRDLVRNYLGDEFRWTVQPMLQKEQVPKCRLGTMGQLGWTTWLGSRKSDRAANEVTIDPFFATADC